MNDVHSHLTHSQHHRSVTEARQTLLVPQLPQSSVLILSTNVYFEASQANLKLPLQSLYTKNNIGNTIVANSCSNAMQRHSIDHEAYR